MTDCNSKKLADFVGKKIVDIKDLDNEQDGFVIVFEGNVLVEIDAAYQGACGWVTVDINHSSSSGIISS